MSGARSGRDDEQLVLDDDRVVDREDAGALQHGEAGFDRVGNQRRRVRNLILQPDGGDDLAGRQLILERLTRFDRDHVRRWTVLGDVLVARQHPRDLPEIDAVLVLQHAARPESGRDGVAAVDADPLAFQILRAANAGVGVDQNCAVMKRAHREDRDGGERLPVRLGAQVRGHRHLRDVEVETTHHSPERLDDDRHVLERELERPGLDRSVLEGLSVSVGDEGGLECEALPCGCDAAIRGRLASAELRDPTPMLTATRERPLSRDPPVCDGRPSTENPGTEPE